MAILLHLLPGERKEKREIEPLSAFDTKELELYAEYLFDLIEKATGVTKEQICSKSRAIDFCSGRRIFAVLFIEKFPTIPDSYIASQIDHDRTTILAARNKHEKEKDGKNKYATFIKKVLKLKKIKTYSLFKDPKKLFLAKQSIYTFHELNAFFLEIGINFRQWVVEE